MDSEESIPAARKTESPNDLTGNISRRNLIQLLSAGALYSLRARAQTQTPQPPAATESDPLRTLRAAHPRLLLFEADFDRLRFLIHENTLSKRVYSDLEKECDRILSIPPVEYKFTGPRLQAQTRRAIDRIAALGVMYGISGRDPWLHRAMLEMNAAAAFKDWNPSRLIDTAEMTCAFAIGYDWLYSALTPEERTTIREAIVTKSLDVVLPVYQKPMPWTGNRPPHWNPVCNAGFAMGALAVADEVPDKSTAILRGVLESAPHGMQNFGPEGAWPEGPANSEYALRYACMLCSALTTALGSDSGISATRGFDRAGRFHAYTTGPALRGSPSDDSGATPELFWLAKRFNSPGLAWMEERLLDRGQRPDPLDLGWFERDVRPQQPSAWPLDAAFHSVQTACFRSSWDDANALFFAIKGGDNKSPRGRLDLGSFVLEVGGVRWALDPDLGDGPSAIPAQQTLPAAWLTRTEAHNTLLIDNENQDARAEAAIVHQEFGNDLSWIQIDLSKANGPKLKQWTRRAGMVQRQAVLIEDIIHAPQPIEVVWGMLTEADISLNGTSASLKKGPWNLAFEIRTPRHAVFDTLLTGPSIRKLIVRLGEKTTDLDLSILITPWRDGQTKPKVTGQFPEMASATPPAK
ncbi:MAG TPA: heparinase II/III family protein [Bryobacteraceae bacterium]|nr:heparinase II/III family protein [Bryobacteraceae bacterium]